MKEFTSMKITKRYNKVWRCGYCDLQKIVNRDDYNFYNSGVYGWNCDILCDPINDQIITTGYRNMRGERIPSELIKKYNDRADAIREEFRGKWDKVSCEHEREKLEENKNEFLKELANI